MFLLKEINKLVVGIDAIKFAVSAFQNFAVNPLFSKPVYVVSLDIDVILFPKKSPDSVDIGLYTL